MTDEGKEQLEKDEGRRAKVYLDSKGIATIGVGRNLRDKGLANDEINFLFSNDIRDTEQFLWETFSGWNSFTPHRQDALVNLCFNTGNAGFLKFKKMVAAIKAGNWETASAECKDSEVYKERPDRIGRIADALKEG